VIQEFSENGNFGSLGRWWFHWEIKTDETSEVIRGVWFQYWPWKSRM